MKFSVVIPLYNKEHYILRAVNSVLCQTYKDYEIIVVNDGSSDNSLEVVKQIDSDRLELINQLNQGVAVARNTGIKNSRGEFIAFLDADDCWCPNYLEEINKLIEKFSESDIFVTSYRIVLGKDKNRFSAHLSEEPMLISSYWETFKNAYDTVWTSATVIRKTAIEKAGMFTPGEKIGQDLDLWARVARNNPLVAYTPTVCVDYNRNAEHNARTRVRIAFPKAFLRVLTEEMASSQWSDEDKKWMKTKYNKKMIVYCYTMMLSGQKKESRNILRLWAKQYPNKYIPFLWIASYMPMPILRYIYKIRLKVF